MMYAGLRVFTKLKLVFTNHFSVAFVVKPIEPPRLSFHSMYKRETKIAVNNDERIPMIKVVANPLIGPVPTVNRMIAVIRVVAFESRIAPLEPL